MLKRYFMFLLSFLFIPFMILSPVYAVDLTVDVNEPYSDTNHLYAVFSYGSYYYIYYVVTESSIVNGTDVSNFYVDSAISTASNGYPRFGFYAYNNTVSYANVYVYSNNPGSTSYRKWNLVQSLNLKANTWAYVNTNLDSSYINGYYFSGGWYGVTDQFGAEMSIIWGNDDYFLQSIRASITNMQLTLVSILNTQFPNTIEAINSNFSTLFNIIDDIKKSTLPYLFRFNGDYNQNEDNVVVSNGKFDVYAFIRNQDFTYDVPCRIYISFVTSQLLGSTNMTFRSSGNTFYNGTVEYYSYGDSQGYFYNAYVDIPNGLENVRYFYWSFSSSLGNTNISFNPITVSINYKSTVPYLNNIISLITGSVSTPGVSQNDSANANLGNSINSYDSLENQATSNLISSMSNISTDINLFNNTDFIKTGQWVATQIQTIYQNDIMGLIATFSLVIGLALALIGFRINNK